MADRNRMFAVEALRGLAALSVAWFHLTNTYTDWVAKTGSLGWLGVEVFFVISGFVIPYSLSQMRPAYRLEHYPSFVARRLVRLEPPYLVSILLVIILWHLSALAPGFRGDAPAYQLGQVAAHLFYLVPLTHFSWLQPVYWTLAYEFVFYLAIGLLYPLLASPRRALWWRVCASVWIAAVALGALPPLWLLFLFGIQAYRLMERQAGDRQFVETAVLSLATLGAMILVGAATEAVVGAASAAILLGGRRLEGGGPVGRLSRELGALSYSLYLLHVPIGGRIVNLGRRFVSGPWSELALSILALGVCLACAWVFRATVEAWAINLSRRLSARPAHAV